MFVSNDPNYGQWQNLCLHTVRRLTNSALPSATVPVAQYLQGSETLSMIHQFLKEEEGQTLVEYGLLISLIALVVIAILSILGNRIKNTFNAASNALHT
jgi:pilus assembly protein Flp/PilA